jgi:hypothetical protein
MLRIFLLTAMLAQSAAASPVDGSGSASFRATFDTLLRGNSQPALRQLHVLAETDLPAAVVALPFALRWMLNDDRGLRRLNGAWVSDVAEAAHKPTALWQGGAISATMRDQLNRALWLYELGEDRKGDALLEAWLNHMPETAPLPYGFADLPAAPLLKARLLIDHIARGDRKAVPVLQGWLDRDLIEGWMTFAELSDHYPVTSGEPLFAGLSLGANTGKRLQDGRRAYRLLWAEEPPPPLPPETLDMSARDLIPRPQYAPVRAYCAAACPASASACEAAFVSLLGAPYHAVTDGTPMHDTMDEPAFFATPRGAQVLLADGVTHRLGMDRKDGFHGDLTRNPAFQAAGAVDACFANGVLQAMLPLSDQP